MIHKYICLILLGFCGCANAVYDKGMNLNSLSTYTGVCGLPAVEQSGKYLCGYACFSSVALYYNVPPAQLTAEGLSKYGNQALSASRFVEMARKVGLCAFAYQSDLADIQRNLSNGRPIIILLNSPPRTANWPAVRWAMESAERFFVKPHWVVVTAISSNGDIFLHDPRRGRLKMTARQFKAQWDRQANIAVLIGRSE